MDYLLSLMAKRWMALAWERWILRAGREDAGQLERTVTLFKHTDQLLAFREFLALLVDGNVFRFEGFLEGEEILMRVPAVDGDIASRTVGVA